MSISIEKLSLLDSLVPLRLKVDAPDHAHENGFVEKLDKALGGASQSAGSSEQAREVAENLTLQMLQSSLTLSGDSSPSSGNSVSSHPLTSIETYLKAYRDNLAEDVAPSATSPAVASPVQNVGSDDRKAIAAETVVHPRSTPDTSWLNPVISRASQKYGVDANLIRAVVKAESNFNPQAVSHAGARGLMQLMPATARFLGVSDSFDPEQNVMGGTRFLKDMLQRYDGNIDSALAAYNWGPGNVDRRPDNLPRETRDYLVRVKQLYASYSA